MAAILTTKDNSELLDLKYKPSFSISQRSSTALFLFWRAQQTLDTSVNREDVTLICQQPMINFLTTSKNENWKSLGYTAP